MNYSKIIKMASIFIALLITLTATNMMAEEVEKVHMAALKKSVRVIKHAGDISFRNIPSPGNNYDELLYNVKIGRSGRSHYLKSTLRMTPERDDRITAPYIRLISTNGVEFAMMTFSNAMFWSEGKIYSRMTPISELPRKYYIACGFAYYYDSMYPHMQGGPQETIVDSSNGKIIYRGKPWYKDDYQAELSNKSGLMFVGETVHARILKKECSEEDCSVNINYKVINVKTGNIIIDRKNEKEVVLRPKRSGNFLISMVVGSENRVYWRNLSYLTVLPKVEYTEDPEYLGQLSINDSVACGLADDMHGLQDGRVVDVYGKATITTKLPGSTITNIFGGRGRVVNRDRGFFGYNIGLNLTMNMPYLVEIEFADDKPRTMAFIIGKGNYSPAVHTGYTLGQPEPRYFSEHVMYPISGGRNRIRFLVWAGEEEVRNGFYVGVADPGTRIAPYSNKPLLLKVSLYNMLTMGCPKIKTKFPKEYTRYAWTEYDNIYPLDQVRFSPHMNALFYGLNAVSPSMLSWNAHADINNSIMFRSKHYQKPLRKFIKGVEYDTDKLEPISNRYNFADEYVSWAKDLKLKVFPKFEYGGSDILAPGFEAIKLDGQKYSAVARLANNTTIGDSVDICYPEVVADFKSVINDFCESLTPENRSTLRQPVIRRRGNFMSVSFSEKAMKSFEEDNKIKLIGDDIKARRADVNLNHLDKYRIWYQTRTFDVLAQIYDLYWTNVQQPAAPLLYYHWNNTGMPYEGVYYHNLSAWEDMKKIRCLPFEGLPIAGIKDEQIIKAVPEWTTTEEGLSIESIKSDVMLPIAPISGLAASDSKEYLDLFKLDQKLAVKITGTTRTQTQIKRGNQRSLSAGTTIYHSQNASMFESILAFANATPDYLIYEQTHASCFPFPEYSRRFFMNYLSLPAVPFKDVTVDQKSPIKVLLGEYRGRRFLAVVNKHFEKVQNYKVSLPISNVDIIKPLVGKNEPLALYLGEDKVSFYIDIDGLELRSFEIKSEQ